MFRMSYEENISNNVLTLWIRPNDIADLCQVSEDENPLSLIEKWKSGLNSRIVELVMQKFQVDTDSDLANAAIQKGVDLIDKITTIIKGVEDKIDIEKSKQLVVKSIL